MRTELGPDWLQTQKVKGQGYDPNMGGQLSSDQGQETAKLLYLCTSRDFVQIATSTTLMGKL